MDAPTDNRPIVVRAAIDKVQEEELARLIGTTCVALKRKRERGVIPAGVYAIIDGRIMYSIKRCGMVFSGADRCCKSNTYEAAGT